MKPISVQILISGKGSLEKATDIIIAQTTLLIDVTFNTRFQNFVTDDNGGFELASLIRQQVDVPPGKWCISVDSLRTITLHAHLLLDGRITLIFESTDLNIHTQQYLNAVISQMKTAGIVLNEPVVPQLELVT
jgi:hypothetical protein